MKHVNFRVDERDIKMLEEIAVKKRMVHGINITVSDIIRNAISDLIKKEHSILHEKKKY